MVCKILMLFKRGYVYHLFRLTLGPEKELLEAKHLFEDARNPFERQLGHFSFPHESLTTNHDFKKKNNINLRVVFSFCSNLFNLKRKKMASAKL